jgi:prepilin-type N-terminal cleavage/methylation domain-containing protein
MRRDGFTLIELLVVISIIAVLAGMLLPAIGSVRDAARQAVCANQQRQVMLGILTYADEAHGQLPPAGPSVPAGWPYGRWYSYPFSTGHMPEEWLMSPLSVGSYGLNFRYPNPLSCPTFQPRPASGVVPTYTLRWFTNAPGQPTHADEGFDIYGGTRLGRVNKLMPFLAESTHKSLAFPDITANHSYWWNVPLASGWIYPYLLHRGRSVATYPDGHVVAHTAQQLAAEDHVVTALSPP